MLTSSLADSHIHPQLSATRDISVDIAAHVSGGSRIRGSRLRGLTYQGLTSQGAHVSGAHVSGGSRIRGSRLRGLTYQGLTSQGAHISGGSHLRGLMSSHITLHRG